MVELEGTTFDHYVLKRRLARGGMSEVYLAYDQQQRREVAIKVVNRENSEHAGRFRREVDALHILRHKHILPTLDYGEHEQWLYLVMPYIEHGTLRDLLHAKGRLTQEEAGAILVQVCEALQFAHDHGIVHRDIKPSNILLYQGKYVYLADFGLAKEVDALSDLTQTGCLVGTPEYMAPELADEPASKSSDIYSVGIVLYQMLTGQTPFRGTSPLAVYWKHMQEEPVRPSLIDADIPWAIEQVMLCALEKAPLHRFQNAQSLAYAYGQALAAPAEHPQMSATAPLISIVSATAMTQKLAGSTSLDLRTVASAREANAVDIAKRHGVRRPKKIVAGAMGFVLLLMVLPLSFGYALYTGTSHPSTALGASAPFASSIQTSNQTGIGHPKTPPRTPPPTVVPNTYHPTVPFQQHRPQSSPSNKHGHKHGHGHGHD